MSSSVKPIPVDPSSPVPLYFQAARYLQRAIETGELLPGTQLDNEVLLAERFGLSRPTMRRAMQYLVDKGMLVRKRGVGTQVVGPEARETTGQSGVTKDLAATGQAVEALGNIAALVNARPASSLTASEIATAARAPLTILGRILRETRDRTALTTQQTFVLSQLMATDPLPITDLAEADGRAVSTMAEIVTRMTRAGLVTKSNGIDDRRQVLVSITPKGRAAVEGSLQQRTTALAERIERLSDEERRALAAALPALWKLTGNDPETWPRIQVRRPLRERRTSSRTSLHGGLLRFPLYYPSHAWGTLPLSVMAKLDEIFPEVRSDLRTSLGEGYDPRTLFPLSARALRQAIISLPLIYSQGNEVTRTVVT